MILGLLIAAHVVAAPAAAVPARNTGDLLGGAEAALRTYRLDQANVMVSRAVAAGASGPALERVLADLAYVSGKNAEALARYEVLLKTAPNDVSFLEPAGIAALKLGNADRAASLLSQATSGQGASWRAWNALGVAADMKADWTTADKCFAKASQLAPREAAPVNNQGWSLLLRGEWQQAGEAFERAAAMGPKSRRIANNAELAKAALAAELPRRQPQEPDWAWAERLNDAGMAAAILGDKAKATAAFTQALHASGSWYERAANNLEALGGR